MGTSDSITTKSGWSDHDVFATGPRLCGNLDPLIAHMKSVVRLENKKCPPCLVCGSHTNTACGICGASLHYLVLSPKGIDTLRVPRFFRYHNTQFFGQAKCDHELKQKKRIAVRNSPSQSLLKSENIPRKLSSY